MWGPIVYIALAKRVEMNRMIIRALGSMALFGMVASNADASTFEASEKGFQLDGQALVVRSGEVHYPRVPREYWRNRMQTIRAMGLNTVSTYVFWNQHEPMPGHFEFTGQADVAEFCRTAQQEGLKVVITTRS